MITIKQPRIESIDNGRYARLIADVAVEGSDTYPLWLQVESQYGRFLCFERSDAYVAALFHWAMTRGHDIICEAPITREMYHQINDELIPMVAVTNKTLKPIKLIGPIAGAIEKVDNTRKYAGASGSCGVDALWTLKKHLHKEPQDQGDNGMDITHLMCMRLHVPNNDDSKENCDRTFEAMCANAASLAKEVGIGFISVESNFDNQSLPGLTITRYVSYGPAFAAFALQKLFSYYYLSSGYSIFEFNLINEFAIGESAAYELVLCPMFSTQTLTLYSSGTSVTRIEKVRDLKDWQPAWKHLNVCMLNLKDGWKNCTFGCTKCYRTILELMAISTGVLDKFDSVFDVPYVKSHLEEYAAELLRGMLHHDFYMQEVWPYRHLIGFSKRDWIGGMFIVMRKIIRKILRLGRTGTTWHSK